MQTFMVDILLQGIDTDTRLNLLPREQDLLKEWEDNGTLLASYLKGDTYGIYLVLMAADKTDVDNKLATLPYYPYMKIEINTLK